MRIQTSSALLALAGLGHAVTISTYPSFGADANPTFVLPGQSFIVPDSNNKVLTTWKAAFYNQSNSDTVAASLYTLSGLFPDQLIASDTQPIGFGVGEDVTFNFNTLLQFDQQYLMVFTNNGNSGAFGTHVSFDIYADGSYWRDVDGLSGSTAPQFFGGLDSTFEATFAPVPEPGTIVLLGFGITALLRKKLDN